MDIISIYKDYLSIEKKYSSFTVESYIHDITSFESFLKTEGLAKDLLDAKRERLARNYISYLDNQNYEKKSIARKISALKNFYTFLVDKSYIEMNIFDTVKAPKIPKNLHHIIDDEAISYLFKSIDTNTPLGYRNYLILDLLYSLGLRASEIVEIKIGDIYLSNQQILIHGKGSKDRYVVLHEKLITELKHYLTFVRIHLLSKGHETLNDYLLINYKGSQLTSRGLRVILNQIIKNSGETYKIHPHMLRHAVATTMINHGADLRVVQELLGHENLKSTQIYTHVSHEKIKETYTKTHPRMVKHDKLSK